MSDNSSYQVALDATAPSGTTLNDIASNNLINKAEHDAVSWLTGSAEASAKITIKFINSSTSVVASTRNVDADQYGNWYLPYSSADLPADGTYTVSVTATDAAGNESTAVTQTGVLIDSVLPSAPSVDNVATDDTVDAAENTNGFNIPGTGENGSTISLEFSIGHTLSGGNTAPVSGELEYWVAAQEAGNYFKAGEELITVTQTDVSERASTKS